MLGKLAADGWSVALGTVKRRLAVYMGGPTGRATGVQQHNGGEGRHRTSICTPLFEKMGLVICSNLHRNSEGG